MAFANPWWLLLLALPVGVVVWYAGVYRRRRLVIRLSYDPQALRRSSWLPTLLKYLPLSLLLLASVLLILALARPVTTRALDLRQADGIDIALVLDLSRSMETTDFLPSRLAMAREQALQFVRNRREDRIALIVFAETAVTLAPLTLDHDLIERFLRDELRTGLLPAEGTAIGTGVGMALNRLAASERKSKVIVLLTDGKATAGVLDPLAAARLAAEQGVRIYPIGVGRETYTLPNGRVERTDLDEPILREMAQLTGGRFYRASEPGSLPAIFQAIDVLERSPIRGEVVREATDRYPQFLLVAFGLICLALTLMRLGLHNWLEE